MAGKFGSEDDSLVYQWSLDGTADECGDVSYGDGWHGLVLGTADDCTQFTETNGETYAAYIVHEGPQGFVDVDYYVTESEARAAFDEYRTNNDNDNGE